MTAYYIAASSKDPERERAKRLAAALEDLGGLITHRWWVDIEANIAKGLTDRDLTSAQRRFHADADRAGILAADEVILLIPAPENTTKGAWYELAVAIENGITTHAIGDADACIFISHASHFWPNEAAFLDHLNGDAMRSALEALIETVEMTGGLARHADGEGYAPVAARDWGDLAIAYEKACAALGRQPMRTPE